MKGTFALVALLAVGTGCSKLTTIRIEDEATTLVAQGTLVEQLVGQMGFGDFLNMDLTQSAELRNQGVEPGDIEDVRLEHLEMEVTSPSGADLSFLEDMQVFVEAPGVTRALMAEAPSFPAGEPLVVLDRAELDLTPYVVSQSMTFETAVTGRRPEADTEVTARFRVALRVTGQGIRGAADRE